MALIFSQPVASVTAYEVGVSKSITFAGMTPSGDSPQAYVDEMNKFAAIGGHVLVANTNMSRRITEGVINDG